MTDAGKPALTGSKRILGWTLLITCTVLFFGGLFYFNYSAFSSYFFRIDPESPDAVISKAKITDRYSTSGARSDGAVIDYVYTVNGKSFSKEEDVDNITYHTTLGNDSIDIVYLKSQPENSNVLTNADNWFEVFKVVVLDIVIVIAFIVLYRRTRKESDTLVTEETEDKPVH